MTTTPVPPSLSFEPDYGPYVTRLQSVICRTIQTSIHPHDRQMFSRLLEVLSPFHFRDPSCLPSGRADGRGTQPTTASILYSTVLQAIRMIWTDAGVQAVVPVVERAEHLLSYAPYPHVTGDSITGFDMVEL